MSNVFFNFASVSYVFLRILQVVTSDILNTSTSAIQTNCSSLQMGQYLCNPEIDPLTQQPKGCSRNNIANTICIAAEGIQCIDSGNNTFSKEIPCLWTNGYSFETSLLLSVFLGMFGADRFYLGYPAIGLFKLCTLGCMFLGQIVDIILIATQTIGPADGSYYVINYFGPKSIPLKLDNDTYRMPQVDWPEL
ncbi:TM2 domain-containing protein CG10795-like [Daphnia carinata]|uniref:TM2 domain-containing protein CG10795-like n=1 Tax=Daphnia carinata TaxID=120202 RepID=UPI00257F00EC|nr:TM2 domain-containing protein CG10795-like [Daphnia carinata]